MRATRLLSVPGQIAHRLAARDRMGDQGEIRELERVDQRGDIVGEGIEIIAAGGLIGTAMAAPVEADAAEPLVARTRSSDSPTSGRRSPGY